jgi:hypothetical protein
VTISCAPCLDFPSSLPCHGSPSARSAYQQRGAHTSRSQGYQLVRLKELPYRVLRTGRSTRSSLFPSPECSKAASQSTAILSAPSQAELCRGTRFLGAAPAFNVTRSVLYLVVNACNAPAIVRLPARCHRVGPRPVRRHAPVPHRSDEAPQLAEPWQGDGMSWLAEGETGAKQVGGA